MNKKELEEKLAHVQEIFFQHETYIKSLGGCSDGDCIINIPTSGQHTNGGCRCLSNHTNEDLQRGQYIRYSSLLRKRLQKALK